MKKLLLIALALSVVISSYCQTNETFTSGAFIINMGSSNPQTIANGLKPYGLIYDLIRNYGVPVKWIISTTKSKDGTDFTYNSTNYKGGTFLIPSEYRTTAVNSRITYWTGQGVVGTTTTGSLTLPVTKTITAVPRWTLDATNGAIAEGYLINAGITNTAFSNAYNWKDPSDLTSCDDLFVLPHAEPTWSTHSNLYTWNRTYKGAIYASCHAVSVLESLYNPSNHNQKMNFLSKTGLDLYYNHNDGTPPYTHRLPSDPVAQYMGSTDAAMTYGSETIFIPLYKWRSTTNIIAYDPSQSDVPFINSDLSNAPAVMVYGRAWGDSTSNCGWVMYEAGHSANRGTTGDVAAQRAFFDFSFFVATDKSPTINSITGITANSSLRGGQTTSLTVNASMGSSNSPIASYAWTVSINGGTTTTTGFSAPTSSTTNLTLPAVSTNTTVIVTVTVTDICGRSVFQNLQFTLIPVTITGKVWDDADASVTINGTEAGTNAGGALYAILANSSNVVTAVTAVAADGTYTMTAAENATYNIILSSTSATVGSTAPSPSLPSNWVNTGENQNGTIKTTNLGKIPITVTLADFANENFGIEQLPNSDVKSYTLSTYPRLNTSITLNGTGSNPGKLTGTDPEDGTLQDGNKVVITTVPSNAQLYYNGVLVTNGYTITNYNPALLSVKFNTLGATSVVFNYAYVDAANKQDPTPATYTISWTTPIPNPISISGKVWDDADGSITINGTEAGTNAGGTLYAILASTSSTTIAVCTVANGGTYSFTGIDPNTSYKIILSTSSSTVGSTAPAASLPTNWVNTGENMNGTTETITPGVIAFTATATDVVNENFGIEQLPNSDVKSYTLSTYPVLNSSITLNGTGSAPGKLTGTDPEDGTLQDGKTVVITTVPGNAQLYYNGVLVTNGYTITNYNSALLTVKFNTVGATSVVFNYAYVDAAGKQDPTPATYTISWTAAIPQPINISGKIWDDADGSITINGTEAGTNAGTLHAVLAYTTTNTVVAVVTVASNGTYSFSNIDPNSTYKIILTTSNPSVGSTAPAASLPTNWVNTGENMNGTTKTTTPGVISLSQSSVDVTNENFGIEQLPNSDGKSYTLASSPALNSTIVLNGTGTDPGKLTGTDPEDGTMQDGKKVVITTAPVNAELYYNGVLVTNGYTITNYNSALLTVKFTQTGVTYFTFNYAYVDAAGKQDPTPASYTVSWGTATFLPINISGTVWDDANGNVTTDGAEAGTNAGGLYAILTDNSNNVVAIAPVNADGTYAISNITPNTAYSIVLSTTSASVGSAAPSPSLPSNWVNTGQNVSGVSTTNTPGKISFSAGLTDISNQDFGIEQLPNSDDKLYTLPDYPRLNTSLTLNGTGSVPGKLTGSDPEDGILQAGGSVIITTVPNNAQLYYNGVLVNNGDAIDNYDPSLLSVKFTTVGATSVTFNYAYTDAADLQDPTPGIYTITWTTAIPQPITISGLVWDDANGNVVKAGTETATNAGGLYAVLANTSSNTVAVVPVANDGTYSFTNIDPNNTYSIILTTANAVIGSAAPLPSLPTNWVNTGENKNGTTETVTPGIIALAPTFSDISNMNFGIEQLPNSDDKTYTLPTYPMLNTSIALNGTGSTPGKMTGTDPEDGLLQDGGTIVITSVPSNAQLYYNGIPVTPGTVITGYDPSQLRLKFTTVGATSIVFNYAYVDAAGKQDPTPATYIISWSPAIPQPIVISGKVWDDANGSITMDGTEVVTNAGNSLYVALVDSTNNVSYITGVAPDGTYYFNNIDPNHTYSLVLTTTFVSVGNPAPSPSLPANWVNTGENVNGLTETTTPGVIALGPTYLDLPNMNFGIERLPNSDDKNYTLPDYPRLNTSVTLNGAGSMPGKLTGTDPEDGLMQDGKDVAITTVPNNAELYYAGTLLTNGFVISNYDPSLLTVKFTTVGATSVVFNYAYVDSAGKQDPTPGTYTITWTTPIPQPINISGTVWDDGNGTKTMDAWEAGTSAGGGLFAILTDASNNTIAISPVDGSGAYSFSNVDPNFVYKVIVATTTSTVGSPTPSPSLPANWVNTGQNANGTIVTTPLGIITIAGTYSDVINQNFGIEQLPNSDDKGYTLSDYPRLNSVLVLNGTGLEPGKLTGVDPEDGPMQEGKNVVISTVPNNAQLYYNGTLLTNGYTITNYDPSLLSVKFTTVSATSVAFSYAYIDSAGKQDPSPGTYTITWTTPVQQPITISGKVWDDANGNVIMAGTETVTNAGGLYAILADSANNVIAVATIGSNGLYSFLNVDPNISYQIIVSSVTATVGGVAPSPSLPANWVNTGQNVNGTIQTTTLGIITIAGTFSDVTNQDFGIEQLPNSDDKLYTLPDYPRLNTVITLNGTGSTPGKLTGTDPEDGSLQDGKTVVITTVPGNAELYYNGTLVTNGFAITNYDPSLLTVKFTSTGATSVVFNYAYVDAAGKQDPIPGTYTITWTTPTPQPITISGKVWDDANGNAIMAGTETATNAGGLYAILADNTNHVVAVATVNADGTYSFSNIDPNATYNVIVATTTSTIGSTAPSPSLPANWVNTGQNVNGTVVTTPLGIITIAGTFSDVTNQDFGIEQLPNSDDKIYTLPDYPRLNTIITLNGISSAPGKLTGTDPEDGNLQDGKTVIITTVPNNAQLYYNGTLLTNGYTITNYDPSLLSVKFTTTGATSVVFNYAYVDAAGKQDPTPGTYTITWTTPTPQPITISGKVWDDANGSVIIESPEAGTNAGGLYAILADASGNTVSVTSVNSNGTYSFSNVDPNFTYKVIVATTTSTIGSPASSPSLPANWVNTGQNVSGTIVTTPLGIITIAGTFSDVTNQNFGIEQLPNSDDKIYTLPDYPRLNTTITLNGSSSAPGKLTGTDPEDGLMQQGKNVVITTVPANAELYYNGVLVTNGFTITNYDPSLLTVKFTTVGAISVVFNYAYVDAADKQDPTPGTYTITWTTPTPQPITISGKVWDDANGSITMDGAETVTNAGGLYAILADASNNATIAVVPVSSNGLYSFSNLDPNTTYKIVLSTSSATAGTPASSPSLPANWVNIGQNENGTIVTSHLGVITLPQTTVDAVNMDFAIEQLPNSHNKSYNLSTSPILNSTITLNGTGTDPGKLTGIDPEDGAMQEGKTIVITSVPTNSELYYNGVLVTNGFTINNYDPSLLVIKFTAVGTTSTSFTYAYVDAAGKQDPTPATYIINWGSSILQPITVSGNVWDDANGSVTIDGTEAGTNASGLYAILSDNNNNVIAVSPVSNTGTYSFTNLQPNNDFTITLSTINATVGSTAPSPSLPSNWVNIGQNVNGATITATLGSISFTSAANDMTTMNFGIEQLPNSDDKLYTLPDYPRLNTSITLNSTSSAPGKLTGADPEDGLMQGGKTVVITTVPNNADLYYNGTLLTNGYTITNYNPALLSVKFTTLGATSVVFNYAYVDAAGKQDVTAATYTITWTDPIPQPITITGKVWDDANGNVMRDNYEAQTNSGGLYVILANTATTTISVAEVQQDGTYGFNNIDPNTTYQLILSINSSTVGSIAPAPSLHMNWVNTGENMNGTIKQTLPGIIVVASTSSNVVNMDFGIEQLPNSDDKSYSIGKPAQNSTLVLNNIDNNAGGKLTGLDPEDGTMQAGKTVVITAVPNFGELYYNGVLVTNGFVITNYDPTLMSIKFTGNGYSSLMFHYAYVDAAGKQDPTPAFYALVWPGVLAVQNIDVSATLVQNTVQVKWIVANEANINHYEVERSTDGVNFSRVADASALNNGQSQVNYGIFDNIANIAGGIIYYRIKQISNDGKIAYSVIVPVYLSRNTVVSVFPTLFNDHYTINYYATSATTARVIMISNSGALILNKTLTLNKGANSFTIDEMSRLAAGVYNVVIQEAGSEERKVFKMVKQN